jgi:hypothetical protein
MLALSLAQLLSLATEQLEVISIMPGNENEFCCCAEDDIGPGVFCC